MNSKLRKQLEALIPHPDEVNDLEESLPASKEVELDKDDNIDPSIVEWVLANQRERQSNKQRRIIDDTRFEKLYDVLKVCCSSK